MRWFGSKAVLAPQVTAQLGDHVHYVEVFAGSAAVLFDKERSRIETINDVDGDVVNLFRVMADPATADVLTRRCCYTPYARAEFSSARALLEAAPARLDDPLAARVERAWAFLVAINFSVSRTPAATGWSRAVADPGGSIPPARWLAAVSRLDEVCARLRGVQVECADWREILVRFDRPTTVFYLDPPYHPECRSGGQYRHDLTAEDHVELVEVLLALRGRAVLSGFAHRCHGPLVEAGWDVLELPAPPTRRHGTQPAETLWVSPVR